MNIYLVLFKLDQQLVYEKFQRGHLHEMKLYDIVEGLKVILLFISLPL